MSKPLQLTTVRLGTPRQRGEGLRIGTVRFLPRGTRKQDYARRDYFDVWLPNLAPSRELLSRLKKGEVSTKAFLASYRREMHTPQARHLIRLLAEIARRMPIAVGCYCEDEARCHRCVLGQLIRQAGGRPVRRGRAS